jgi:hypothetical protein
MSADQTGVAEGAAVAADERVDVLRRHGEPAHFILHGRLYRVREILSRWIQVGADSGEIPAVLLRQDRRLGTVETLVFGRDREVERELWSVRASVGRDGASEVFQLCHDLADDSWRRVTETLPYLSSPLSPRPESGPPGWYSEN